MIFGIWKLGYFLSPKTEHRFHWFLVLETQITWRFRLIEVSFQTLGSLFSVTILSFVIYSGLPKLEPSRETEKGSSYQEFELSGFEKKWPEIREKKMLNVFLYMQCTFYSQTKWSVPLKITLMNWSFGYWTRQSFQECNNELIIWLLNPLAVSRMQ